MLRQHTDHVAAVKKLQAGAAANVEWHIRPVASATHPAAAATAATPTAATGWAQRGAAQQVVGAKRQHH